MPLDHYIPQVHLKNFYSTNLGNRLYALRKSDLKPFTPTAKAVCRITDGNTNAYLSENRAIEEFLRAIEPKYNIALNSLASEMINHECIYTIAGFVAYIITCSPTGMRIQSEPFTSIVKNTAILSDSKSLLPSPPQQFADKTISSLLQAGEVVVKVDPKYPQAIGINSILKLTATFGNFEWEILHNDSSESSFFTSDFPAAIEQTNDPRILNRIVPLSPNLALRIKPEHGDRVRSEDLNFSNFSFRSRRIRHNELVKLNRLIVRCAEDNVFYRDNPPWLHAFVQKNRFYRIYPYTQMLSGPSGKLQVSTQRLTAHTFGS